MHCCTIFFSVAEYRLRDRNCFGRISVSLKLSNSLIRTSNSEWIYELRSGVWCGKTGFRVIEAILRYIYAYVDILKNKTHKKILERILCLKLQHFCKAVSHSLPLVLFSINLPKKLGNAYIPRHYSNINNNNDDGHFRVLIKHLIMTQHQKIWWWPLTSACCPFTWDIGHSTPT